MKNILTSFFNKPKIVALTSLVVAVVIGVFGYININKIPLNTFTQGDSNNPATSDSLIVKNLSLGFLTGGRIKTVSVKAGDHVKGGQVLATLDALNTSGALTQAKAALEMAKANYQKVINGATGPTIDVAKAAVNTAKVNLEQTTKEQDAQVVNARRKLYSADLVAEVDGGSGGNSPLITGNYNGQAEGDYRISFRDFNFIDVNYNGPESGTAEFNTLPRPLGSLGLLISFPLGKSGYKYDDTWVIHIPNKSGPDYTTNFNAYELALQNKDQAIAGAQAALDQAQASLASLVSAARGEDIAGAQAQIDNAAGALQIATAAFNSTQILAPGDGEITAVYITEGQIATPNSPAIEFLGLSN